MISETALLSLLAMSNCVCNLADNKSVPYLLSLKGAVQVCGSNSVLPWSIAAVSLIISAVSVICMLSQW